MNDFLNWDTIGTFGMMVATVSIITEVVKYFIPKVDPKWIALVVTLFCQISVQLFSVKDFSASGMVMAVINAFVVLASAIGAFEGLLKPIQNYLEKKTKN